MVSRTTSGSRAGDASGPATTATRRMQYMSHADLMTEQQRYYHDLLSSDDPGRLSEEPRRLHSSGVQQRRTLEDCVAGHSHVYLGSVKVKEELGTSGLSSVCGPSCACVAIAGRRGDQLAPAFTSLLCYPSLNVRSISTAYQPHFWSSHQSW